MTSSSVLRRVKAELGIDFHKLEISDDSIMDIIKEDTLETFSIYFPDLIPVEIYATSKLPEHMGTFEIVTPRQLVGVSKLYLDYNGAYTMNSIASVNPAERQMAADLMSMATQTPTFKFRPPNKVEIYPKNFNNISNRFMIEAKAVHLEDFSTIHLGLKEEFLKLCIYDVKKYIFGIRSEFENNNTLFGEIRLNIDKFSNAEADRDTLINLWRTNQHKTSSRQKVWTA